MNLPKYDRYVYMLFAGDAATPFYVGIGKHGTRRHEVHGKPSRAKNNPAKYAFIRECKGAGIEIRYVVPETCLTIDEACRGEIELISIWGRREFGGCLFNISAGGFGIRDPLPSTRTKLSAWQCGRKLSQESIEKMAVAHRGKKPSASTRAKMSAWHRGKKRSPEIFAKIGAALRGKKRSPESCAKISAALLGNKRMLGKKRSPETCARIGAANRGKKRSPDFCAKISAAHRGRKKSPEHVAKVVAATRRHHADRVRSPDQGEFKF